jgi:multidrug efflux pump
LLVFAAAADICQVSRVNISAAFISRPVATTLLTIGIALAGMFAFFKLPVSPLPQVDFPTISVQAQLPGASPDTVATSVASPLERHLGQIADVTQMTSTSSVGSARIVLQFGLDRDINGAARDVQAAINAARADLPSSLRSNPTYRKVNPADAPVLILALTSETLTRGQMYDAATNVLSQKLSQINGIGQVIIGGAALPAVRVELNPTALFKYGIGLEDVRAALASANANSPKGSIDTDVMHYQLYTNDQASHAADYKPLVIAYRNGAAVRLSDMADVQDSVENLRNAGLSQGKPAVLVILFRQPGANIINTVDGVKAAIPQLMAAMPRDMDLLIANDRTTTIRASLQDTEMTLVLSVGLVTLVVFLFLRNARATLIPAIAVPVSIIGTFGTMYLMGYSLDNLSLMALTVATGFVVDDAIVVLENISRHMEDGMPRVQAALLGAREVGFTVISISVSLIAVFLPILLMGGIVGRLFREFAVTLSLAIAVSLAISLTTTPMMCALFLKPSDQTLPKRRTLFDRVQSLYGRTLAWSLRHSLLVMLVLLVTVVLNIALYVIVPKGFFPQQDTGRMMGGLQADQSISFQAMQGKLADLSRIVQQDPAVQSVVGFTGAGGGGGAAQTNTGSVFVALKPLSQRDGVDTVMARLRRKLAVVPGARLFLVPIQDISVGGRQSNAAYQYTLQADSSAELYEWAPKLLAVLEHDPILRDVNSDQQQKGLETDLVIDRGTASRLGVNASEIDNTLYDAFGQRQVSTIYSAQNQYHVIMEVAPRYWQSPATLKDIYVSTSGGSASGTQTTGAVVGTITTSTGATKGSTSNNSATTAASIASSSARNASTNALANVGKGSASSGTAVSTSVETMIPLAAFTTYGPGNTALAVNHQGSFVASTISFNLAPGKSLGDATAAVEDAMRQIRMPASIHGAFQGTAQTFQQSLNSEPILIAAALLAIYIVLGVLYESYIHPITIISTLPSAGVGAVLALMLFNTEFSIIALIGVILLIGIVKKNAILMIDFALEAERMHGLSPREAIFEACLMRFRPIMMTTSAAMLGALPLALSFGDGGELRRPLGISIVGGLMVSQVLTLYTTPVVYLYLDRFRLFSKRQWNRAFPGSAVPEAAE